jgi:predicted DNA-binding transcriptional regulator YafY
MEALVQAETIAAHAGPRPFEDAGLLATVRQAIKSMQALRFTYEGGSTPGRVREVTPLGILFGRANYLVASEADGTPRSWRFDRIGELAALDRFAPPPPDFSLQDFADESFGIYHGEVEDVVLVIAPERAADALSWRFHANQTVESQPDGSVRVAFRAGGMLELAWHLFTWGDAVTIVAPQSLKTVMREELERALAQHGGKKKARPEPG